MLQLILGHFSRLLTFPKYENLSKSPLIAWNLTAVKANSNV